MKKVLILGTSHVGAFHLALNSGTQVPEGIELDFLFAAAPVFPYFDLDGAGHFGLINPSVVPAAMASRVKHAVEHCGTLVRDLRDFSHIVMAGLYFNHLGQVNLLAHYNIDGLRETDRPVPRLSASAFAAFAPVLAFRQYPERLIRGFAEHAKVGLSVSPRFCESALSDPGAQADFGTIGQDTTGVAAAFDQTDDAVDAIIRKAGHTLLRVPRQTLTPSGFTALAYRRQKREPAPGEPNDHFHMDGAYGDLRLTQIFDWVQAS